MNRPTDEQIIRVLAEKAMGWEWCDRVSQGWGHGPRVWITGENPELENSSPTFQGFDPFNRIEHAFMVVEKMRENGWIYSMNDTPAPLSPVDKKGRVHTVQFVKLNDAYRPKYLTGCGEGDPVDISTDVRVFRGSAWDKDPARAISLACFSALEGK